MHVVHVTTLVLVMVQLWHPVPHGVQVFGLDEFNTYPVAHDVQFLLLSNPKQPVGNTSQEVVLVRKYPVLQVIH
jgi:hypothetical protein